MPGKKFKLNFKAFFINQKVRINSIFVLLALFFILSCDKEVNFEELPCQYIDFCYSSDEPHYLGEMSGNYITLGSDMINNNESIQEFISSKNYFDKSFQYQIKKDSEFGYKYVVLKLSKTCNCGEVTWILDDLKMNSIVDYAHYTIQTDNCGDPLELLGELCVDSYNNILLVSIREPQDTTALKNTIQETNTRLIGKLELFSNWYLVSADKNSEGDALEMANYFYETGLFDDCEPGLFKTAVK